MGRLRPELLERAEGFCDRCLDVVDVLDKRKVSIRVLDQLTGSATSFAANLHESDEALSRKDFCKVVGISIKELNETKFWIRLVGRRGWVQSDRLVGLLDEADQLKRIVGSILARTRENRPPSNQPVP